MVRAGFFVFETLVEWYYLLSIGPLLHGVLRAARVDDEENINMVRFNAASFHDVIKWLVLDDPTGNHGIMILSLRY